jgi:hypothetical protein
MFSLILLYPSSPPFLELVSAGLIFPFSYMCTEYFLHIHLLHPFPTSSLLPLENFDVLGMKVLSHLQ